MCIILYKIHVKPVDLYEINLNFLSVGLETVKRIFIRNLTYTVRDINRGLIVRLTPFLIEPLYFNFTSKSKD